MTTAMGAGIDIFIHPGEWFFGDGETRIWTTLGSSVSVTLWHPRLKVGGLCHYMLPGERHHEAALNPRYGHDAVTLLMAEVQSHCTEAGDYEAKLFGGASMFDLGPGGCSVARQNVEAAEHLVIQHGLNVVARSLGGTRYRQLVFNLVNGDVWVRQGGSDDQDRAHRQIGGAA
ncbi:MAG: chemotaxis protein CheD [Marinobacter sp.]